MIALLSGEVAIRRPDGVVVLCAGVGYRLAVSAETLRHVPAVGREASLHAHLVVRDDALQLYGFAAEEERDLFLMLIGVQSVGPKVALAVLSGGPPRELVRALAAGDSKRFQAVPGIGKRTAERIVVEAAGVGYRLMVSTETLRHVPAAGQETQLHTQLVVRDDAMQLYGFATEAERELFLMLVGVQGVGPKVALAVLSGGTPRELLNAMASGDAARFQAVPGIGKRTAERIIVELREKVAGTVSDEIVVTRAADDPRSIAREGLLGLGFDPREADELLEAAAGESPEDLIAEALRAAR